ncbi:hypothetical protein [Humibacillus xanthopallidus]|uniref:Uncharacterized protein n=1 Tax=Humibacillus xanthopallidus TaxID=412689 RepID=A0A543I2F5_9MICO|nr:hypothetical protein [Humibacillus xanthopallidus]TQM64763.1 hypothetical protein FBY41_1142 [Humibacillus xanthopallidus]
MRARLLDGWRAARPVPDRWPAGAAALLGVALSAPSVVAPTWVQTVGDRQRGDLLSGQSQWSWGRVELTGLTGVELGIVPNPVGLVVAVTLVVLAVAAVTVWVLARGPLLALAPIGLALLAGRLLTTSAERHGRAFHEAIASEAGLTVTNGSTTAGWLETAAAAVLVVALALMVVRLVTESAARIPAGAKGAEGAEGAEGEEPAGRHTGAVATRAGLRPKGARLSGPEVGLTDEEGR